MRCERILRSWIDNETKASSKQYVCNYKSAWYNLNEPLKTDRRKDFFVSNEKEIQTQLQYSKIFLGVGI